MLIASTFSHNFLHFFADFSTIKPPSLFFAQTPLYIQSPLHPCQFLRKLFVEFSTPVQNFLTLPCYQTHSISFIPALSHFVFFNFHYIITERFYLQTLSFYFKIYYLNKCLKKPNTSKNRTNSSISFFLLHQKNRTSIHFRKPNVNSHHFRLFHKNSSPNKQCT